MGESSGVGGGILVCLSLCCSLSFRWGPKASAAHGPRRAVAVGTMYYHVSPSFSAACTYLEILSVMYLPRCIFVWQS